MASGYTYGSRPFNRLEALEKIRKAIPSIETVIVVPFPGREEEACPEGAVLWQGVMQMQHGSLEFEPVPRSEEHTSELQSLMRTSYAVFCLKKHKNLHSPPTPHTR